MKRKWLEEKDVAVFLPLYTAIHQLYTAIHQYERQGAGSSAALVPQLRLCSNRRNSKRTCFLIRKLS
jgi:hypothetical protein